MDTGASANLAAAPAAEQLQAAGAVEQEDAGAAQPLKEVPPAPLSMAQVVATVEAALQGLRGIQARGAALNSADLEAWERDLHEREMEFQRRSEQL